MSVSTVLAKWILGSDVVSVIQVLQALHNFCRDSVAVPGDVTAWTLPLQSYLFVFCAGTCAVGPRAVVECGALYQAAAARSGL